MIALAVILVQVLAAIGFGAFVLAALKVLDELNCSEALALSFAIGLGVIGWLVFMLGVPGFLSTPYLGGLLALGVPGLLLLRGHLPARGTGFSRLETLLLVLIAVALLFDLSEALSPPGDGDSLAYHFALPKKFIEAGRIIFEPRAIDGAVPLLTQMTYVPALALGGEKALTLWVFVSGWAAGAMLFVLSRRHLSRPWSLALLVAFMTVPAVVYGAGSGQVEVRIALFVMVAAFAVARALETGFIRYAVLAGLATGFFVATKYLGLLFAVAAGLVLLARRGWFVRGLVYSLAVIIVGSQWYVWNWWHTGDPVFPVLFDLLGNADSYFWDGEHQSVMATYLNDELGVPVNLWWLIAYPFKATLAGLQSFESTRTGFGPLVLLLAPFAGASLWVCRERIKENRELVVYALIAVLFYTIWFYSSPTQRIRHLLPVLPLIFITVSVAAERFAAHRAALKPLIAAFALTIILQLGGHALFSMKSVRYMTSGESRDQYLARTVSWYEAVPWINANLGAGDKVLSMVRWYVYLLDVPYYWAHEQTQSLVHLLPGAKDAGLFFRQARAQGVTHVLSWPELPGEQGPTLNWLIDNLEARGCLSPVQSFSGWRFASRTLPVLSKEVPQYTLYKMLKVDSDYCSLPSG